MMISLIVAAALNTSSLFPVEEKDTAISVGKQFYVKAQYAGNIGLVSAGAGYDFSKWVSADLSYGYLPKMINGVRVHTLALKPAIHFIRFNPSGFRSDLYFGTGITCSIGHGIHLKVPDYYPIDYYLPNGFHFHPFVGARTRMRQKDKNSKNISFFAELGTVEYNIYYLWKNSGLNLMDILNLGFGASTALMDLFFPRV